MTQGTGGTDDVFKVSRYAVYPRANQDILSPEATQKLLADFKSGTTPLSPLPPPSSSVDTPAALQTIATHTTVDLDASPSFENQVKQEAVKGSLQKLASFAKNHPWLTLGFALAGLLLAGAVYLTVQNFLGHETLTIFQAHPALGLSVIGMLVFYTAYLINMCKRAAMKDELEAKIEAQNKFIQDLATSKELDMQRLIEKKNSTILALGSAYIETENINRTLHEKLVKRCEATKETVANIQKYRVWLIQALIDLGKQMSTWDVKKVNATLQQTSLAVDRGARLLALDFPITSQVPLIPQLELLPSTVTFPPLPTEAMEENKKKLLPMGEKIKNTLERIGTTLKESPGTVLLLTGGILMCLLSGMAIGFYLQGVTNLYFFGSLSLTTIIPLAIYGLSMIYEGYNSATITNLERDLKTLEKITEGRKAALAEQEERVKRIHTQADTTLEVFSKEWAEFQNRETSRLYAIENNLQDGEETNLALVEQQCLLVLQDLYKDAPPEEIKRLLHEKAQGAILLGT